MQNHDTQPWCKCPAQVVRMHLQEKIIVWRLWTDPDAPVRGQILQLFLIYKEKDKAQVWKACLA